MGFGSPIHWIVIGVVALLLFGNRLPEVARSLGKAWNEFRRGLRDVSDEFDREPSRRDRLEPPTDAHKLNSGPSDSTSHSDKAPAEQGTEHRE